MPKRVPTAAIGIFGGGGVIGAIGAALVGGHVPDGALGAMVAVVGIFLTSWLTTRATDRNADRVSVEAGKAADRAAAEANLAAARASADANRAADRATLEADRARVHAEKMATNAAANAAAERSQRWRYEAYIDVLEQVGLLTVGMADWRQDVQEKRATMTMPPLQKVIDGLIRTNARIRLAGPEEVVELHRDWYARWESVATAVRSAVEASDHPGYTDVERDRRLMEVKDLMRTHDAAREAFEEVLVKELGMEDSRAAGAPAVTRT